MEPEEHIIDIEEEIIEAIPKDKKTVIFKVLPKTREIELLTKTRRIERVFKLLMV